MKLYISLLLIFAINSFSSAQECATSTTQTSDPRPTGLNQVLTSTHFKIHYTTTGDDPNQTTITYVNKVRDAAEASWTFMYNDGWRMPPNDGDGYYDIYILNFDNLGSVTPETQLANGQYTSYMKIINVLPANHNSTNCNQITYDERIQYLLGHEFGHACQFAYGRTDVRWFGENTSVYLEWHQFGNLKSVACRYDISGALHSGNDPLRKPHLFMDIATKYGGNYSYHMYTGGLWPLFLHQFYGTGTVRNVWEYFAQHPTEEIFSAFNNSLTQNQSSSLPAALQNYGAWRYFTGSRNDGEHFDGGSMLPEVPLLADYATLGSVSGDQGSIDANKINGIGGAQYVRYKYSDGINSYPSFFDVTFDGSDTYTSTAANISVNTPSASTVTTMSLNSSNYGQSWIQSTGTGIGVLVPVSLTPQGFFNYSYFIVSDGAESVTLKNELPDLSNAGGTLTLQRSTYTNQVISNNPAWVDPTKVYSLKTDNERFIGGQINKHLYWNTSFNLNLLRRTNYSYESDIERARFNPTRTVFIGSAFIDKPTLFADKIKFHDPWYLKDANFNQPSGIEYIEYDSPKIPTGAYNQSGPGVLPRFDNPLFPNYSMQANQTISGSGFTGSFVNWSTTGGANVTSPLDLTTNATFLNNNDTIRALYKAQLATGSASGYASSSQRKTLRTPDGYIHVVYESAGKVWYERGEENNGNITWYLANEGLPLSGTSESKSPSLANSGNTLLVTYQEKSGSGDYKIILHFFESASSSAKREITSAISSYSVNAEPVVGYSPDDRMVVVWKQSSGTAGLYFNCATVNSSYQLTTPSISGMLSGTDANSSTPSIDANRTIFQAWWYFQLVYTHSNTIQHRTITYKNDSWTIGSASNISSGSGFTYNFNPSIISWGTEGSRVTWIGKRWEEGAGMDKRQAEEQGAWVTKTLFKDPSVSGTFYSFEQSVNSANIQKNIAGNGNEDSYIVAWSALYGTNNKYVRNTALTQTKAFSVNGEDVQVIGGTSFSNMYGTFLNYSGSLFKIERSSSIQTLGKQQTQPIFIGREGIVSKNNAEIFFTLGDVQVEGETIEFEPKHDTLDIDGESALNEYLTTKPFILTNRSQFLYSIQYGFTDSAAISHELQNNSGVSFRVELIDHETNKIIGSFDEITYSANNLYQYNKNGYLVNTEGIGTKTARLRLVVHSTITDATYALNNAVSSESVVLLGKQYAKKKSISYKGTLAVTDYALDQNYPNPFNPTTTISYALPNDGIVTLKVYDALGREVITLVNEYKQSGRYTASFNASNLSSGVYIYKMVSGNYSATKKMSFVK